MVQPDHHCALVHEESGLFSRLNVVDFPFSLSFSFLFLFFYVFFFLPIGCSQAAATIVDACD